MTMRELVQAFVDHGHHGDDRDQNDYCYYCQEEYKVTPEYRAWLEAHYWRRTWQEREVEAEKFPPPEVKSVIQHAKHCLWARAEQALKERAP